MIKNPSGVETVQRQFHELDILLMNVVANLSPVGDPTVSAAIRDIKSISQSLLMIARTVRDQLDLKQSQLGALMRVGHALNSSLGLKRVLEEVMDLLIALTHAERGFLMLRDPDGQLSVRIARGLDRVELDKEEFKVSRSVVQHVAESGEPVLTTNAQNDARFDARASVVIYQLRSILCAPLKLKNDLIGVLYVDNRAQTGVFGEGDLGLISAFADQAAVAIDSARLFEDLQASHRELEKAYEATLEGWAKALELKDKGTEGHTQRVAVLTERLARSMGVDENAVLHIKRGALLHDIGKMGIPDSILLKNGPLTEEERRIVEQHPLYAYQMLSSIDFLLPALDIPYCHHEKWDGTGYPRRLQGEEIPFAARLFPVVDVWDALVSDRPYRGALAHKEVRRQIKDEAGKHFDPRVVEAFLALPA
jgi:putative nucleotidyltransferase with HDIG domain